jgi:hypothetical protein
MYKRIAGLIFVFVAMSLSVFSQNKTVTNADLEKYKQKRLAAQKELRENYAELGFASPEEQARLDAAADADRARRAEKYREQQSARKYSVVQEQPPQINYYYQQQRPYRTYFRYGYPTNYYYGNVRVRSRKRYKRGPGFISNPIIRGAWQRSSAPMRRTYRGNNTRRNTRP